MSTPNPSLPPIHTVGGKRVILDSDLAQLYGVATKVFNQAISRNIDRFPEDFAFHLTREDVANLKSQIVTSSLDASRASFSGYGGARKLPWVGPLEVNSSGKRASERMPGCPPRRWRRGSSYRIGIVSTASLRRGGGRPKTLDCFHERSTAGSRAQEYLRANQARGMTKRRRPTP